jgi:hypothetical protein
LWDFRFIPSASAARDFVRPTAPGAARMYEGSTKRMFVRHGHTANAVPAACVLNVGRDTPGLRFQGVARKQTYCSRRYLRDGAGNTQANDRQHADSPRACKRR